MRTEEAAVKINSLLQSDGMNVRKVKAIKGISDLECIKQTRFTGNSADKFMKRFNQYLAAAQVIDTAKW